MLPSSNQFKAVVVRLVLCLHFVLVVWRVTLWWSETYWLLAAAICPFLLEGLFTVLKRNGEEWKLFSLCFFFYLCATLPGIWLLEISKTDTYQNQNNSQLEEIKISGVEIPVRLSPNTWVLVVEELMLYLMILGRWLLPRGDVGREQLTQLLFGFLGIASDIMELFSLFDEDSEIRHNAVLTYVILAAWSLSVMQFTLTFTTAHRPRRARGLRMSPEDNGNAEKANKRSVLRVELLATVLSLFMQDGPFLVIRVYSMVTFKVVTYSLVFFSSKNALVILLLVYKTFLLLNKLCCPKVHLDDDDDDEGDEEIVSGDVLQDVSTDSHEHYKRNNKMELVPDTSRNGHLQSVELRRRRGDMGEDFVPADFDLGTAYVGDLQKVLDGPGTPAKPMEKTKKYDKHMVKTTSSFVPKNEGVVDVHELSNCVEANSNIYQPSNAKESRREAKDAEFNTPGEPDTNSFSDKRPVCPSSDPDELSENSGHPEVLAEPEEVYDRAQKPITVLSPAAPLPTSSTCVAAHSSLVEGPESALHDSPDRGAKTLDTEEQSKGHNEGTSDGKAIKPSGFVSVVRIKR